MPPTTLTGKAEAKKGEIILSKAKNIMIVRIPIFIHKTPIQ